MKRYFFLCGCLLAMFASSCSDEIIEQGESAVNTSPTGQGNGGEIVITMPTQISTYGQTRAGESIGEDDGLNTPGTCTVTNCVVLVFSAAVTDEPTGWLNADYKYEKSISLEFKETKEVFIQTVGAFDVPDEAGHQFHNRQVAEGSFKPETGKWYRLYAYAYNATPGYYSGDLKNELTLTDETSNNKILQNKDEKKTADDLAKFTMLNYQDAVGADEDSPMELFGGFLGVYKGDNWGESERTENNEGTEGWIAAYKEVFNSTTTGIEFKEKYANDDEKNGNMVVTVDDAHFGGDLKRLTGRLEITLTDIPEDVASLGMIMERYQSEEPVGKELIANSNEEGRPIIYFCNPFEPVNNVEVDKRNVEATPEGSRSVTLTADMLRTENSYVYIRAYDAEGKEIDTYTVRCKNKEVALGPDAIVETIVSDGKVTVPANFWLQLKGDYKQLQKGNMSFDVSWGEDYNSNITMGKE